MGNNFPAISHLEENGLDQIYNINFFKEILNKIFRLNEYFFELCLLVRNLEVGKTMKYKFDIQKTRGFKRHLPELLAVNVTQIC